MSENSRAIWEALKKALTYIAIFLGCAFLTYMPAFLLALYGDLVECYEMACGFLAIFLYWPIMTLILFVAVLAFLAWFRKRRDRQRDVP